MAGTASFIALLGFCAIQCVSSKAMPEACSSESCKNIVNETDSVDTSSLLQAHARVEAEVLTEDGINRERNEENDIDLKDLEGNEEDDIDLEGLEGDEEDDIDGIDFVEDYIEANDEEEESLMEESLVYEDAEELQEVDDTEREEDEGDVEEGHPKPKKRSKSKGPKPIQKNFLVNVGSTKFKVGVEYRVPDTKLITGKNPVLFAFYTKAAPAALEATLKKNNNKVAWARGSVKLENDKMPSDKLIAKFINWLRLPANGYANAKKLGVDPNRIAFIGYSIGGIKSGAATKLLGRKVKGMIFLNSGLRNIRNAVKPMSDYLVITGMKQKPGWVTSNTQLVEDLKKNGAYVKWLKLPDVDHVNWRKRKSEVMNAISDFLKNRVQ